MKICSKCKLELSLDMFYKKGAYCRKCWNAYQKEWRVNNISKFNGYVRTYRLKNLEVIRAYEKNYKEQNSEKLKAYVKSKHESIKPGVYLITCLINGKQYIGQSLHPYRRKGQHFSIHKVDKYPSSKILQKDLKLYGKANFTFEVIEHCAEEDLEARELHYLNKLKPYYNSAIN